LELFLFYYLQTLAVTHRKKIDHLAAHGKCEEALKKVYKGSKTLKLKTKTGQIVGYILSYGSSGAAYGTEAVVYYTGGILAVGVLCGPFIAADVMIPHGGDSFTSICPLIYGKKKSKNKKDKNMFGLGDSAWKNTKDLRCEDLSPFSRDIRSVSGCYAGKNSKQFLQQAIVQLEVIDGNPRIWKCISKTEKQHLRIEKEAYQKKLDMI